MNEYVVTMEISMYVEANNEAEARKIARDDWEDADFETILAVEQITEEET